MTAAHGAVTLRCELTDLTYESDREYLPIARSEHPWLGFVRRQHLDSRNSARVTQCWREITATLAEGRARGFDRIEAFVELVYDRHRLPTWWRHLACASTPDQPANAAPEPAPEREIDDDVWRWVQCPASGLWHRLSLAANRSLSERHPWVKYVSSNVQKRHRLTILAAIARIRAQGEAQRIEALITALRADSTVWLPESALVIACAKTPDDAQYRDAVARWLKIDQEAARQRTDPEAPEPDVDERESTTRTERSTNRPSDLLPTESPRRYPSVSHV